MDGLIQHSIYKVLKGSNIIKAQNFVRIGFLVRQKSPGKKKG